MSPVGSLAGSTCCCRNNAQPPRKGRWDHLVGIRPRSVASSHSFGLLSYLCRPHCEGILIALLSFGPATAHLTGHHSALQSARRCVYRIFLKNNKKTKLLLLLRRPRSSQISRCSQWIFPTSGLQYSSVPYHLT